MNWFPVTYRIDIKVLLIVHKSKIRSSEPVEPRVRTKWVSKVLSGFILFKADDIPARD